MGDNADGLAWVLGKNIVQSAEKPLAEIVEALAAGDFLVRLVLGHVGELGHGDRGFLPGPVTDIPWPKRLRRGDVKA
jgi:hypothetical protein